MTTQVQKRKSDAEQVKGKICLLLSISHEQYAQMQYEQGLLYLQVFTKGDVVMQNELSRNRRFWAWWRNEWLSRDEVVLKQITAFPYDQWSFRYEMFNDGEILALEVYPCGRLLADSYARVMGEIIDAQTQPA